MADNDYGVPTDADDQVMTRYKWSPLDVGDERWWLSLRLDCGHPHCGSYRKCSSCRRTMCERCWRSCKDPVIKDLLSARVRRVVCREWVNTCSVCREMNPNTSCPPDCFGRQKFSVVDGVVIADDSVFDCSCRTCVSKQIAVRQGHPLLEEMCEASRGHEVDATEMVRTSFSDLHMCRKCFKGDVFRMVPLPVRFYGRIDYKVLFRASAHRWRDVARMTADPPVHYIHSLEGGAESSMLEWAAIHVGKHWSCHGGGHKCEMLSTSLLCSEAVRRLGNDRYLQVICIPQRCWDAGVVDFSSRTSLEKYGSVLADHLDRHRIQTHTFESWALRFREVVIDMRAMRAGRLNQIAFEFDPHNKTAKALQEICRFANEYMHVDSLGFLLAERKCREFLTRVLLETPMPPL